MKDKNEKKEQVKKLVIARLDSIPSTVNISVGSMGSFSKNELIEEIELGTELGEKMIEIELEYLRKLKEGILYATDNSNNQTL